MNFRSAKIPIASQTASSAISILAGARPSMNLHSAIGAAMAAGFDRHGPNSMCLKLDRELPGAPEIAMLVIDGMHMHFRTNTIPGSSLDSRAAAALDGLAD